MSKCRSPRPSREGSLRDPEHCPFTGALGAALVGLALVCACASADPPATPAASAEAELDPISTVSVDDLGKRVKLRGMAIDRMGGAVLDVGGEHVWIDGLHSWPTGYYEGGDQGTRLVVTGILDQDHGLPVFIEKEGAPAIQGIPVPEGTDLEQASRRFVLRDAKW